MVSSTYSKATTRRKAHQRFDLPELSCTPTFPEAKRMKVEEMSSSAPTVPEAIQIKVEEIEDDQIMWPYFQEQEYSFIVMIS